MRSFLYSNSKHDILKIFRPPWARRDPEVRALIFGTDNTVRYSLKHKGEIDHQTLDDAANEIANIMFGDTDPSLIPSCKETVYNVLVMFTKIPNIPEEDYTPFVESNCDGL